MVVKKIRLEDILQYISGSGHITKQIRSDTITIKFRSIAEADDEKIGGFMINTCEMSILFPPIKKIIEEDRFEESFLEYMTNSPGLTHIQNIFMLTVAYF